MKYIVPEIYYLSNKAYPATGGTRPVPAFVKSAVERADAAICAALEKLHAQYEAEEVPADVE